MIGLVWFSLVWSGLVEWFGRFGLLGLVWYVFISMFFLLTYSVWICRFGLRGLVWKVWFGRFSLVGCVLGLVLYFLFLMFGFVFFLASYVLFGSFRLLSWV